MGTFALLFAGVMVLDWYSPPSPDGLPPVPVAVLMFLGVFAIMAAFALWIGASLGLPPFLLLAPISGRARWLRYGVYGIGSGVLIYLTNGLYLTISGAPMPPGTAYELDNHLEVFSLSAHAALAEETMFRLFAIPFLVSLGMRFYGWRPRFGFESGPAAPPAEPVRTPRRLLMIALLVSALMFGLAHSTNSVAAAMFGVVLGIAYLRGGWESAVTAHFLGNYLLFAGIYL